LDCKRDIRLTHLVRHANPRVEHPPKSLTFCLIKEKITGKVMLEMFFQNEILLMTNNILGETFHFARIPPFCIVTTYLTNIFRNIPAAILCLSFSALVMVCKVIR